MKTLEGQYFQAEETGLIQYLGLKGTKTQIFVNLSHMKKITLPTFRDRNCIILSSISTFLPYWAFSDLKMVRRKVFENIENIRPNVQV